MVVGEYTRMGTVKKNGYGGAAPINEESPKAFGMLLPSIHVPEI